ncbi:serine proteinase inhibitor [Ancylostoma ceylanicum]|uniref:Serine proteinase inhibitor n=1 Tax=Ancylostoma ceylanicum TaxID=53326 RepID=A0A0D6LR74_9BILA|nr:serine proteinase inhibitor [Ancylostoma ceylanicum]
MNFGLNMLRQSPMNETMAVSPLSVIFALALVHAGAEGDTKIQINQVISNGTTDDELIDFYSNLARSTLMPSNGVQARIANAFFLKLGIDELKTNLSEATSQKLPSEPLPTVLTAKMVAPSEQNIVRIPNTNHKSALISAFHEKYSIEKEYTDMIIENYSAEVEVLDFGQTKQATKVDLSSERDESRNDAEDEHMEVLSLRYNNTCCAFNIIFPKKMLGIDELKTNLSEATSQKLPSEPLPTVLTISLPRMTIETDSNLKEALIAMGVTEIFSERANLTGIAKSPPLAFSDAAHKVIVEIDEGKIVAAAATVLR